MAARDAVTEHATMQEEGPRLKVKGARLMSYARQGGDLCLSISPILPRDGRKKPYHSWSSETKGAGSRELLQYYSAASLCLLPLVSHYS